MNDFAQALAQAGKTVSTCLADAIADLPPSEIRAAMAYATLGGKRLRGFLVMESARLHGITPQIAAHAGAAIEAIHAYSLIHDDLPAMDDDRLRRGQPTVHIAWDEATAILAGDALQSLAFAILARDAAAPTPQARLELIATLAHASGAAGMVLGQAQDIAAETAAEPLGLDDITAMQAGKTGALIEWSACAGARIAGADITALGAYARNLGLAFQIADDILDIEGDVAKTGKALHKDERAGKATFVSLLGMAAAKARAKELVSDACDALAPYGRDGAILQQAAHFVIGRDG